MANNTQNTSNLIRQEMYSKVLLESFDEFVLNQSLFRDYTAEFTDGDTLNIDQIGDILWTPYAENTDIDFTAIDTSRLTLTLSDYNQDGFYITDKLKQDSWKSDTLFSTRINKSAKRLVEDIQTDLFAAAEDGQTAANANTINGQPHRFAAPDVSTVSTIGLSDISKMKLVFDKANVPQNGRILIVDATVENVLNDITNLVSLDSNPAFQGIVETGFARDHKFLRNIYGFDIWVSNLLPRIAAETIDDRNGTSVAIVNGFANLAMYVGDEDGMPVMGVMRNTPSPEFERNSNKKRDEWSVTERHGFGLQRPETLGIIITEA